MKNEDIISKFNEIYNSTHKAVLAYITAKCKATADISDIFQNTYMELYQVLNKRGVSYITDEKGLVFRITKRKLARHYSFFKRMQNTVPITSESIDESKSEPEISDIDLNKLSMEDIAVNQILLDNIKEFVRQKPEDVKKVFYLFYEVGQTIPEIAELLSISQSSVKNKLYRTIKELRSIYNVKGEE
ncbi:MAG: sigma-70 family RNA polymerase sigma factor [Oscillospiraceae bacterium]|jgi:RNA polymerase sigma-70 factor (ECF subfamily)|nr:sigma-70 family RNA polymerase sigma factor [Oscillospiraceae bacterium]